MKKCIAILPLIALALVTMFICIGCSAKETPRAINAQPLAETLLGTRNSKKCSEPSESVDESAERAPEAAHESGGETTEHQSGSRRGKLLKKPQNTNPKKNTKLAEETTEHQSGKADETGGRNRRTCTRSGTLKLLKKPHSNTEAEEEHETVACNRRSMNLKEKHASRLKKKHTPNTESAEAAVHETESAMVKIPRR